MEKELVLVVDFGGQYNQLIARRIRECHVYCEIIPWQTEVSWIKEKAPKAIVFTGGPNNVSDEGAPCVSKELFELGIPILGICYGEQLIAHVLGGKVEQASAREYGNTTIQADETSKVFNGLPKESVCWMSHTFHVTELPTGFKSIATSESCPNAAFENESLKIYGLQFHPEVKHSQFGQKMIENFLFKVCGLKGDWSMSSFAERKISELKEELGDKKVICALSGGVDSSVAAVLVHRAIHKNLTCIFVDHGLLRKGEAEEVYKTFKEQFDMNLIMVNASERFLSKLSGVVEPEQKRKIIGEEFIRVFEEEASKLDGV